MKRGLRVLLIGAALIGVGNAAALIGVAYNRSGEPRAVMEFSEREFMRPYAFWSDRENSGMALNLSWRMPDEARMFYEDVGTFDVPASWLDRDKLIELGFDVAAIEDEERPWATGKMLPRAAWIVLELDGPVYREVLARCEAALAEAEERQAALPEDEKRRQYADNARAQLKRERHESSRLFAVDAGLDRDALRQRYSDRARYLVLPGHIDPMRYEGRTRGVIAGLEVAAVHVPLVHRESLGREGKYTVTLAFGRRDEPWIVGVRAGADERGG